MAANDRPSASSSPPLPGPSSSASGDQPDGQSGRKRSWFDEMEIPQYTPKRSNSEVTRPAESTTSSYSRCWQCQMRRCDAMRHCLQGQYLAVLTCITTPHVCCCSKEVQVEDLNRQLQSVLHLHRRCQRQERGMDYAALMIHLLSEGLKRHFNSRDEFIFSEFFGAYLKPDRTEPLLKLCSDHTTNLTDKRRILRILLRGAEKSIVDLLRDMRNFLKAGLPHELQRCQRELAHLVQVLPAPLHDASVPAIPLSWYDDNLKQWTPQAVDHAPMFAAAVECQLVPEAKLLYEAGAVNKAELTAVAKTPGIQKMLNNEEDQSEMAMFLQKVLRQPQCLESMALLQVSRLVGQEDVLGREDRVRQLPLPPTLWDAVLLRPLVSRYRLQTCDQQTTDGGV